MRLFLFWLWLSLAAAAVPPGEIAFRTDPPGCDVAQRVAGGWQRLSPGRSGWQRVSEEEGFRILKPGYRTLELKVPAQISGWPPPPEVLCLEPLVSTVTFVTWPPGARMWLPVPGGGREYLGLSGQPVHLNLARVAGDSGQGVFTVVAELEGFHDEVLTLPSHLFADRTVNVWPAQGAHPLRARYPVLVPSFYVARAHPLLALLTVGALAWLVRRRPRRPLAHYGLLEGEMVPLPGAGLGPYQLDTFLGAGGMGLVYSARRDGERVALKLMRPAGTRSRFQREIVALTRLVHPHILKLLDWGESEGLLYLVTEYVEGGTLRGRITPEGVSLEDLRALWLPVVEAVAYAHRQGVLHRDLKPENVLLGPRGPLVADFGLCRLDGPGGLTATQDVMGTPGYLAPELLRGAQPSAACDQYALGVLAYELLCGQAATLASGARDLRERRPDVPVALAAVVERMLAERPEQRFASLDEVGGGNGW